MWQYKLLIVSLITTEILSLELQLKTWKKYKSNIREEINDTVTNDVTIAYLVHSEEFHLVYV